MTTIKLLDARRGLNLKCRELFADEKIAEAIYRYLCDGIEECEDAEPVRMKGKWIAQNPLVDTEECSVCGYNIQSAEMETPFCPWCGVCMSEGEEDE